MNRNERVCQEVQECCVLVFGLGTPLVSSPQDRAPFLALRLIQTTPITGKKSAESSVMPFIGSSYPVYNIHAGGKDAMGGAPVMSNRLFPF